jgi:hypothetical protein
MTYGDSFLLPGSTIPHENRLSAAMAIAESAVFFMVRCSSSRVEGEQMIGVSSTDNYR